MNIDTLFCISACLVFICMTVCYVADSYFSYKKHKNLIDMTKSNETDKNQWFTSTYTKTVYKDEDENNEQA